MLQKLRSSALTGSALTALLVALSGCGLQEAGVDPSATLPPKGENQKYDAPQSAVIMGKTGEQRKGPTIEIGPAPLQIAPTDQSALVFIGYDLPRNFLREALENCCLD